jgi:hypothetical protein
MESAMKKILLASLILITSCSGSYTLTPAEKDVAELGARDFADKDGTKFVSCSGQDSDNDSYVTCTTKTSSDADKPILCTYKSKGCKPK